MLEDGPENPLAEAVGQAAVALSNRTAAAPLAVATVPRDWILSAILTLGLIALMMEACWRAC